MSVTVRVWRCGRYPSVDRPGRLLTEDAGSWRLVLKNYPSAAIDLAQELRWRFPATIGQPCAAGFGVNDICVYGYDAQPIALGWATKSVLGPRPARFLGVVCGTLFAIGLVFRFAIYRHVHIAPDVPFGISDANEAVLGFALVGALALACLVALAILARGPKQRRVAARWLLATDVAIALLLQPLHDLAVGASHQRRPNPPALAHSPTPLPAPVSSGRACEGCAAHGS